MATPDRLIEIATRHQVYLERLKSGVAKGNDAAINKIEKAIVDILSSLRVENMSELTRTRLNHVIADLREVQDVILAERIDDLTTELQAIAAAEAGFEARALERTIRRARIAIPKAKAAYELAQRRPLSATGELLEPFLAGWKRKQIDAVSKLVSQGYANGITNQEMVRAVNGTRRLGYADGLMAVSRRDAQTIVRTAVQHVASAGRYATWEENADLVTGYQWISTLDSKTTQICRSLDGRVFELGKGPLPPAHPRCRSATAPQLRDDLSFLGEGATRSSAEGYVDADLTYYEWLKRQPAAFQDDAIGPARAKLLRDGGLSAEKFAQLNLGRNFQPLTLEQMRAKEPNVFERAGI